MRSLCLCLGTLLVSGVVAAQTMVEAAILTAPAAGTAGKAKSVGAATGNIFSKVGSQLEKAGGTAAPAATSAKPAAAKQTALTAKAVKETEPVKVFPKPSKEDLEAIKPGATRAELIAKAGQPSLSMFSSEESGLVELLSYQTKDGEQARVRLARGVVSSIDLPGSVSKK